MVFSCQMSLSHPGKLWRDKAMVGLRHFLALAATGIISTLVLAFPPAETFRKSGPVDRVDALGDPLPPGALGRIGSQRLRHNGRAVAAFSADGKKLISMGADNVFAL